MRIPHLSFLPAARLEIDLSLHRPTIFTPPEKGLLRPTSKTSRAALT
jgi:hypothetical protein